MAIKPNKPTPDFPLFPHASGQWAKKIAGKLKYFGGWNDPDRALARFQGEAEPAKRIPAKGPARKPSKDFPLFAHASGQWAKKIRAKTHYFGPLADPDAALKRYLNERDELLAGRTPDRGDGITIADLCNAFLITKQRLVDRGEIKPATFKDYKDMTDRVVKVFGKNRLVRTLRPPDFEKLRDDFGATHGHVTLCGDITCTRVLFKYADDNYDVRVKYGQSFNRPTKSILRRYRQERGPKMFTSQETRDIIAAAGVQLRAMIYLGINCGLGNNDCAMLPMRAVDLRRGWLTFSRPKTGIDRRCPLWPETVEALKAAIAARQKPKDDADADRIFITKYGTTWEPKSVKDSPISNEMAKLLDKLSLASPGRGFYALRHTVQTVGEKSRDKDAVRAIMGHAAASNDMSAVYNEEAVSDDRLKAVTDFIREWLLQV